MSNTKNLTRAQIVKRIDQAVNVYVMVEIAEGISIPILVNPVELKNTIEVKGWILGNSMIVREEERSDVETSPETADNPFDLFVGNIIK